jgi:citrate lyase subunit beta / citryl-CoA lyase
MRVTPDDPYEAARPRPVARSSLFVPADRPERFDKAWASAADDVILDLEDAVGADCKEQARANAARWLSPERPALVRINARESSWYQEDLGLIQHPGLRGIVVPKAEKLDDSLLQACVAFGKILIPLVESAVGFHHASEWAGAPGVERLAFGHLDFQVDLGIMGDDDALLYFRSQLVLTSRLAGIQPPLDGVTVDVNDAAVLQVETLRSKRLGFGGKLCIHPRQVDTVNLIFSPTQQEIAWAHEVMDAVREARGAVIAVAGKMIDRPVVLKAGRILSALTDSSGRKD